MSGQPEQMFDKLNQNKTNLADQRLLTIALIVFFGFVNFLVAFTDVIKAFIEQIKTKHYREEMWVYIPVSSTICLLKQLKYYLALLKIFESSEQFIFRCLSRGKKFGLRTKQINR